MKRIVLVTCVAPKLTKAAAAKKIYIGPIFEKLMHYALNIDPDKIFILSGKYGLLHLDDVIEPYDVNLNLVSEEILQIWSNQVLADLAKEADLEQDLFVFLTNETYRKYLIDKINHFEVPLKID
jgi:cytoplasmic iron level regulating protein YaaA (DUF328/UPF0246 family)